MKQAHVFEETVTDSALKDYAASLHRDGYELEAYSVYGTDASEPAQCLFSRLPDILFDSMFPQTGERLCPYVLQALKTGEAFGERASVRERYSDTLTEEQLVAMEAFKFEQVAVVARRYGDLTHMSVIGFDGANPDAEAKKYLCAGHEDFSSRFKLKVSPFALSQKKPKTPSRALSKIEYKFINALLAGQCNVQIADALGLGEMTIRHIEASVCKKLGLNHSRELIRRFADFDLAMAS